MTSSMLSPRRVRFRFEAAQCFGWELDGHGHRSSVEASSPDR